MAAQLDPTGTQAFTTLVVRPGQTLSDFVDLGSFYEQHDVDPGLPVEGDYMDQVIFTQDGAKAIVSNRMTGNITVFDWNTMATHRATRSCSPRLAATSSARSTTEPTTSNSRPYHRSSTSVL